MFNLVFFVLRVLYITGSSLMDTRIILFDEKRPVIARIRYSVPSPLRALVPFFLALAIRSQ